MFATQTRDLSHIELERSDNLSSSSKARTYRVNGVDISTEEKREQEYKEKILIFLLSFCLYMGLGLTHYPPNASGQSPLLIKSSLRTMAPPNPAVRIYRSPATNKRKDHPTGWFFLLLASMTDLDATKNKKSHRAAALCYIKSFLQNPHAPPSVQRSVRNAE